MTTAVRSNRLNKLRRHPQIETHTTFLARIINGLDSLKDSALTDEEVETILSDLEDWRAGRVKVDGKDYHLLKRKLPTGKDVELYNDQPERRIVGQKDGWLNILAEEIKGSDVQLLAGLELQIKRHMNVDFAEQFSSTVQRIIANMFEPNCRASQRFGIGESTIRTHLHRAMSMLGITTSMELALIAAQESLIDLSIVPGGRTSELTPQEKRVLKDHYSSPYETAASEMGISVSTFRRHWNNIFRKTGAVSRVQAALMGLKDGLIPDKLVDQEATA